MKSDRMRRLIAWQRLVLTKEGRGEFLARLAASGDIDGVCRDMDLPRGRVMAFLAQHADLDGEAKRLLEMHTHVLAAEAIEIADGGANAAAVDGVMSEPDVSRDRLRVEARLKVIEKWNRKGYGPVSKVEHTGAPLVDAGLVGTALGLLERMTRRIEERDVTPLTGEALSLDVESVSGAMPTDTAFDE